MLPYKMLIVILYIAVGLLSTIIFFGEFMKKQWEKLEKLLCE